MSAPAAASSASSAPSSGSGSGGGAPVVQGIDTLTSAMSSNIIPDQEYLLQGSILDTHVDVLKHRLRGLCDNVDSGQETFHEREMVFSIQGWRKIRSTGCFLSLRHSFLCLKRYKCFLCYQTQNLLKFYTRAILPYPY